MREDRSLIINVEGTGRVHPRWRVGRGNLAEGHHTLAATGVAKMQTKHKIRVGFTLIEAMLASAVLAAAITGVTVPFTVGAMNQEVESRNTLAVSLAADMLEEILSKPYSDGRYTAGHAPGETRATYNCMTDYDGYPEADGYIVASDGMLVAGPASTGLSRIVSAKYVYVTGQSTSVNPTFIRITVTVSYKNLPIVKLSRLVYMSKKNGS